MIKPLQWRYNEHDGVSNHQRYNCLLNCLLMCRSKKHHSSASLAFVRGIAWWPLNSTHKSPATRKMFPFDDVIRRKHCASHELSLPWSPFLLILFVVWRPPHQYWHVSKCQCWTEFYIRLGKASDSEWRPYIFVIFCLIAWDLARPYI